MLFLLSCLPAFALDATGYVPADEPTPELPGRPTEGGSSSGSGSSGSSGGNNSAGSVDDEVGKIFKIGKIGKWKYQPYVAPGGGVQIDTGNGGTTTSIVAGADVGVRYWRKKWTGDLYLGGTYTTGDSLNGWELHLGDQMGRREKMWGIEGGLEAIYAGYTYADGTSAMKPSFGVGVPVDLTVGPKEVYGFAGVQPNYFVDQSRGLELEWRVGIAANLSWITGTLAFTQYRSAAGVQNTPTLTIGVGG